MSMQSAGGSLLIRQVGGSSRTGVQHSPPFLMRMGRAGPSHWAGRACLHLMVSCTCVYPPSVHGAAARASLCITRTALCVVDGRPCSGKRFDFIACRVPSSASGAEQEQQLLAEAALHIRAGKGLLLTPSVVGSHSEHGATAHAALRAELSF